MNEVNERFKMLVESRCLRNVDVANILGVTTGMTSAWLNGRKGISEENMRKIALKFGVPYDWLKGDKREIQKKELYKKQILLEFYPYEYDLYDAIKAKREETGNVSRYIKNVLEKDLFQRKRKFRLFGKREA